MRRREFISLIGGAAAWPLVASAQQLSRLPTIGFLGGTASVWSPWAAAFVARLRELGWIEGRSVAIEYRWAEGRPERIAEFAAEFVRLKVDVIVTNDSAVPAVKQATSVTPIVFVFGVDPVGSGIVASLAQPGGNVTGLSAQSADIAGKKVELLSEIVPGLRRVVILANSGFSQGMLEAGEAQTAARKIGFEALIPEIRSGEDIAPAFEPLKGPTDALYVMIDARIAPYRARIITLALSARLPTIFNAPDHVQAGGLMSYGPSFQDQLRRAADYVDEILRGAKPADLPIEQPTKFELAINLTTAKALGLTVPPQLLATADDVIE